MSSDTRLQSIEYKGYTIEVHRSEGGDSPRDWSTSGVILTWAGLGDEQIHRADVEENIAEHGSIEKWLRDSHGAVGPILPVFMMDHSGRTLSCDDTRFRQADSHGWDWGQIGYTFATAKTLDATGVIVTGDDRIEKGLIADVSVYNQYLNGEVYGYVVTGPDGEEIDSLWDIYDDEYNASNDDVTHCYILRSAAEEVDGRIETLAEQEVTEYKVEITVEANNPTDAAIGALLITEPAGAGLTIKVTGPDGFTTLINTDDLEVN
jgi:hypothetical protein